MLQSFPKCLNHWIKPELICEMILDYIVNCWFAPKLGSLTLIFNPKLEIFCSLQHVAPMSKIWLCSSLEITFLFSSQCFIATSWLISGIFISLAFIEDVLLLMHSSAAAFLYKWQKRFLYSIHLKMGTIMQQVFYRKEKRSS